MAFSSGVAAADTAPDTSCDRISAMRCEMQMNAVSAKIVPARGAASPASDCAPFAGGKKPVWRDTLKGNPNYDPNASMGLVDRLKDYKRATDDYEKALKTATHPYQSGWRTWPIEKRSIYYYLGPDEGGGKHRYLYLIGNPVVWWGTLFGCLLTVLGCLLTPGLFRPHRRRLAMLAVAWAGAYLPFFLIDRPMFLYHYFFPLMFSVAFAVYGIGILAGWVPT